MTRFNIFNLIHKALRAMLYDTALCLQQTYFADQNEAEAVFAKINEVIAAFEEHGRKEDTIVMPVIQQFQPAVISSFEKDHKDDKEMGKQLKQLQAIYRSLDTAEERIVAGSAISVAFREYMIFNLQHMQREEIELNELLWNNFSDQEIISINSQIVAGMPSEELINTAKWFMKAVNCYEAEQLLTNMKETAPRQVFDALFQLADIFLPERFKAKVHNAVANKVVAELVVN
jgi:hypothetical protein